MVRRLVLAALALVSATAVLRAQDAPAVSSSSTRAIAAGEDIDGSSLVDPSPQYGGGYGRRQGAYKPYGESRFSHVAIEAGGGFTAPLGPAASNGFTALIGNGQPYGAITWGGNFLAGAGWNFSKQFSLLGEFSFNSNKIPGRTLSEIAVPGGNVHTYGLTLEPMFYYANSEKHHVGGYVIGGGGFYRKVTSFTSPVQECDYFYGFCYTVNQTVGHFSANAGGVNIGTGLTYSIFGPDSHAKLFAEARYQWVDTPRYTGGNPQTGSEELIPVSVGLRF